MGGMKLSELDFVRLLPAFMRDDAAVIALSEAMNKLLGEPFKRLDTIRTWDKIDELTEAECDELAWELDIDWYDSTGMSLEEKRNTIKAAQQIKRKRGTRWAVETLITAYFGTGYVREWYETGGAPYTFDVLTTNGEITGEAFAKFVEAAKAAQNARSHLLGIYFFWEQQAAVECALEDNLRPYKIRKCGTYPKAKTLGAVLKAGVETEPAVLALRYSFRKCGALRCGQNTHKNRLLFASDGQTYALYVSDGKLTLEDYDGTAPGGIVTLADRSTGEAYVLYVSGGKLEMESIAGSSNRESIVFADEATGQTYALYISDGKLTMSETE